MSREHLNLGAPTYRQPAFVAANATLVGDVEVGPDANVWFGAVVRGDVEMIRIGARANVQDGVVLHADPGNPCLIGEGCTIGHRAVVHGATLGEHALIGIGANVLNGATIGDFSIIGAGALVPEGAVIPPRSLAVGVPAKVRREISDEEVEMLKFSAAHYVESGKAYQAAGFGKPGIG